MRCVKAALSSSGKYAVIKYKNGFKKQERLAVFNKYWRWDDCKIEVPALVALAIRGEQDAIAKTEPRNTLSTAELCAQ